MAGLRGVEPPTTWFVARCSIQLSYRPAETTHSFPLDYDTLHATSTASGTSAQVFHRLALICVHLWRLGIGVARNPLVPISPSRRAQSTTYTACKTVHRVVTLH